MKTACYLFLCALVAGAPVVRAQPAPKESRRPDSTISQEIAMASGVIAYNPNGHFLAVAGTDDAIRLFDVESLGKHAAQPKQTLAGHTGAIVAMGFIESERNTLVSISQDQTVKTWDVASRKLLRSTKLDLGKSSIVVIAPGEQPFFVSGTGRQVQLWNYQSGERLKNFDVNDSEVAALAFTPDGQSLVIGSYKGVVRVMDVATWKVARSIDLDTPVHALAASADHIAVGYGDGTVAMLSFGEQDSVPEAKEHRGAIKALAFSPDGKRFLSASTDQTVMLCDTETLKRLSTFEENHKGVVSIAFSPDGQKIALCDADGTVSCWTAQQ